MAGAIEKIEQDLAKMDEKVAQLREESQQVYNSYLEILGNAVRQQLILAAYHICTHTYPDRFLSLSVSEREQLQKSIRQVGSRAQEELTSLLEQLDTASESSATEETPNNSEFQDQAATETETNDDTTMPANGQQEQQAAPSYEESELGNSETSNLKNQLLGEDPVHPLAKWLEQVESAINNILHNSSYQANHVLKQARILMPELPDPLLEMALYSNANADTSGPPNVISLYVQAETPQESQQSQESKKKSEPIPITVIALHLAELEFADSQVMAQRNQLRQLMSQFSQLKQSYEQKQQEWLVASAEANWRAIWFEESRP